MGFSGHEGDRTSHHCTPMIARMTWVTMVTLHFIGLIYPLNARDSFELPKVTQLYEENLREAINGIAQIETLAHNATGMETVAEGGLTYGQLVIELQHLVIDTQHDYLSSTAHTASSEAANLALTLQNEQLAERVEQLEAMNKGIFDEVKAKNEWIDKLTDVNEDLEYQLSNVFAMVNETEEKYRLCSLQSLDSGEEMPAKMRNMKEFMAQQTINLSGDVKRLEAEVKALKKTVAARERALSASAKKIIWLSSKLQELSVEGSIAIEVTKKAGNAELVDTLQTFATSATEAAVDAAVEHITFDVNSLTNTLVERDAELDGTQIQLAELKEVFEKQSMQLKALIDEMQDVEYQAEKVRTEDLSPQKQMLYESFSHQLAALKTQSNTLDLSLESLAAGRHMVLAQTRSLDSVFAVFESLARAAREMLLAASSRSEILTHNLMLLSAVLGTCTVQIPEFKDEVATRTEEWGRNGAAALSLSNDIERLMPEIKNVSKMLGLHIMGEEKELSRCVSRTSYLEIELEKLAKSLRDGDYASFKQKILDLLKFDPESFDSSFDIDPDKNVKDRAEREPLTVESIDPAEMKMGNGIADGMLFEDDDQDTKSPGSDFGQIKVERVPQQDAPASTINSAPETVMRQKRQKVSITGAEVLCYLAMCICIGLGFVHLRRARAARVTIKNIERAMKSPNFK